MRFIVSGMGGAIKARDEHLIPDTAAAHTVNQRPIEGELTPWRQPVGVANVPAGRKTIYRMGRDVASDTAYWLSWTTLVHVARGFLANDTTERTYFTGAGTPKVTDNVIGLAGEPYPTSARELGVPAPDGMSTITQTAAGAGDDRLVFYADTFITDKGEESKPRIIGSITAKPGATISITGLPAVPAGNYGVTTRRIYRSEVGTSGQGEFFFLKDQLSTDVSAIDAGLTVGAGVMATTGWEMPPADLRCLTSLWGGMMAAISGRSVRYCESYKPYAWPIAYETLPPDVTPVALAVWSSNLLILSNGRPYIVNGATPNAMGDQAVEFEKGCVSVQSVFNVEHGVVWASGDGLAYFGNLGAFLLTENLLTRTQWQALNPETIVGALFEGVYIGSYETVPGGARKSFAIDVRKRDAIYFIDQGFTAAFLDKVRDTLFILDGTAIKKWDAGALMTATYRSKRFRSARRLSVTACRVIARDYPATVRSYGDGQLRATRVITNDSPVTLRGGAPAEEWQFEIEAAGTVLGASFAPSIADLREGA